MLKRLASLLLLVALSACNFPGSPAPIATGLPAAQPPQSAVTETLPTPVVITAEPSASTPPPASAYAPTGSELEPFPAGISPFDQAGPLPGWQPSGRSSGPALPVDLNLVLNHQVIEGLTGDQQAFLGQNGFTVVHSQEAQFNDIREEVAIRYGQPYFLTSDAAYHALHVTFDNTLKSLEAQYLHPRLIAITQATLRQALDYETQLQGSGLEGDASLSTAYLAVALKLLDPEIRLDPALESRITPQLHQVMAAEGRANSTLFPTFEDDYGAYKPVGHYAGEPRLEAYFRGLTWYSRVHFPLISDDPGFTPSRLPLIITLALRSATTGDQTAAQAWADMNAMLAFLVGPSDDSGPAEFSALMDEIYGPYAGVLNLADEDRWQQFLASADHLPSPQINSTFADSTAELVAEKGWRFMGQRFTLDGFVFQNLVFDQVGTQENPRKLPTGPDVMAAFGSNSALLYLDTAGETKYANYLDQMARLQQAVKVQPEEQWLETFSSTWLYAFIAQVTPKTEPYPPFMQTSAWGYKDLNSALGSWAELKHDTVLYAKMPESMAGGGPVTSGPPPSYVEPNPNVFYRMGHAASSLGKGLSFWLDMNGGAPALAEPVPGDLMGDQGLVGYLYGLETLGEQLNELGDIAVKELTGTPLTPQDYETITACLGPIECLAFKSHTPYGGGEDVELPEVPVVAAVAGSEDRVLEAAVGKVDRIFVVLDVEGELQIAQGGVFSYYEFQQPRGSRLTDDEWRQLLESGPPEQPAWVSEFILPGGEINNVLAFRIGDVYLLTEEGDNLNVREEPTIMARVITKLNTHDYVEIVDGPSSSSGYTWWKVRNPYTEEVLGWVVEMAEWFQRSTMLEE